MKIKNLLLYCIFALLCGACAASPVVTLQPTDTLAAPTATITPTIIWFPPTATSTPFPTPVITPTADMRPKLGEPIFKDDFSDPKAWELSQTTQGSIALGKNELTIAIGENNATLTTFREQPILTDFYLEVTASPSLCRGLDE